MESLDMPMRRSEKIITASLNNAELYDLSVYENKSSSEYSGGYSELIEKLRDQSFFDQNAELDEVASITLCTSECSVKIGIRKKDLYIVSLGDQTISTTESTYANTSPETQLTISATNIENAICKASRYTPNSGKGAIVKYLAFILSEAARFKLIETHVALFVLCKDYWKRKLAEKYKVTESDILYPEQEGLNWSEYREILTNWSSICNGNLSVGLTNQEIKNYCDEHLLNRDTSIKYSQKKSNS